MELTETVRQPEQWRMVKHSIAREKLALIPRNFIAAATPTISSVFLEIQAYLARLEIICAISDFFSRIDSSLGQPLSRKQFPVRPLHGRKGFGSSASKPAPFAEKKNAKDAALANSIRGHN